MMWPPSRFAIRRHCCPTLLVNFPIPLTTYATVQRYEAMRFSSTTVGPAVTMSLPPHTCKSLDGVVNAMVDAISAAGGRRLPLRDIASRLCEEDWNILDGMSVKQALELHAKDAVKIIQDPSTKAFWASSRPVPRKRKFPSFEGDVWAGEWPPRMVADEIRELFDDTQRNAILAARWFASTIDYGDNSSVLFEEYMFPHQLVSVVDLYNVLAGDCASFDASLVYLFLRNVLVQNRLLLRSFAVRRSELALFRQSELSSHVVADSMVLLSSHEINTTSESDVTSISNTHKKPLKLSIFNDALSNQEVLSNFDEFEIFVSRHPVRGVRAHDAGYDSLFAQQFDHQRLEPKNYDAFRIARLLSCSVETSWEDFHSRSRGFLRDDSIETLVRTVLSFPNLFTITATSLLGGCGDAIVSEVGDDRCILTSGVLFRLKMEYRPAGKYWDESVEALQAMLPSRSSTTKMKNKDRVAALEFHRYLNRLIAIKLHGVHPACDPDVTAYWLFDLLEQPCETGMTFALLPEHVQCFVNTRSKAFLRRYPELFTVYFDPPSWKVTRAEDRTPDTIGNATITTIEESLQHLIPAYYAAKATRRSRHVNKSHIVRHLPLKIKELLNAVGFERIINDRRSPLRFDGEHIVERDVDK